MQNNTWVLISDAARARLFDVEDRGQVFKLVQEFAHPESRAQNRDLVTDRPGRTQQSGGPSASGAGASKGNRSGMEPATTPKEVEHETFARELAHELEKGLNRNAYGHLILASSPHFLGLLRGCLSDQVKKHVTATMDKDYTSMEPRELQQRLSGMMPE